MRIILHVGHQKCGSKSIQAYLASNRNLLAEQSIYLPQSIKIGNYDMGLLAQAGVEANAKQFTAQKGWPDNVAALREEIRRRLSEELSQRRCEAIIMSFEGLFMTHPDNVASVIHLLKRFSSDITIYVVVKRQDRWAISNYTTRLKNQIDVESNVLKGTNGKFYNQNFSKALETWASHVSWRNLIVDAMEDHTDIVSRFRNNFDLAPVPPKGRRENTGISAYGQEVFRVFNRMCNDRQKWADRALWIKDKIQPDLPTGDPQLPRRDMVEEYLARFDGDHSNLRGKILPPDSKFFDEKYEFPEDDVRPHVTEAEVEALVDKVLES